MALQEDMLALRWRLRLVDGLMETRLRNLLRCIFREAIGWRLWKGENPAEKAKPRKKRMVREKRKLEISETQQLLMALKEDVRFAAKP